ncbi:MAG TPA: LURP-one-related family protein [Anaerolineales bacterium]|nr:LURP-one-related family protein [Anaerolineales bacterium]
MLRRGRPVARAVAIGAVAGAVAGSVGKPGAGTPAAPSANAGTPAPATGPAPSGDAAHMYMMRQKTFAFGDDYVVVNAQRQPCFKIDGKVRMVKESLVLRDLQGNELYHLSEKVIRVRESYDIERGGQVVARIHNAIVDPLRERFDIEVPGGQNMTARGKIIWAEYTLTRGDKPVAQITKRFSWLARDSYGVAVGPGEDDALVLAIAAAIDMMVHRGR